MKKSWWYIYKSVFSFLGFSLLLIGIINFIRSFTGITGFAVVDDVNSSVGSIIGIFFIILGFFFLSKTKKKKAGHSSVDFLLTYGWAILAAMITIGSLAYLTPSTLSPTSNFISGPFVSGGIKVTTTGVLIEMTNTNGPLTIFEVSLNNLPTDVSCDPYQIETYVEEGEIFIIFISCSGNLNKGDIFKANIDIIYKKFNSFIERVATGLISDTIIEYNTECGDGNDNDGDGWTDLSDPGCDGIEDSSEFNDNTGFHCSDGIDNDLDGLIDGNDPDCISWDFPFGESVCSNGIDDDGDGLIDFYRAGHSYPDPGCDSFDDNNEYQE